ncbi:hypothetical protein SCB49_03684 [unidentified eubacterium SCB49]|nr:hypothetical protein SCB49_03684 [unidentified eubacterium SCB49]
MECKNCKTALDQDAKFCKECGAKVIDHRITLGYLAKEVRIAFFSIDSSKPVRTFTEMFRKPENVIDGYIGGTRKTYIHAFGYFTIAILFSTFFYFIAQTFFSDSLEAAFNLSTQSKHQQEAVIYFQKKMFEYQAAIFYISIPIMAFISFIVFYNKKKYNYAEHLVFNLYAFSQISIVAILLFFATIWNKNVFPYVQVSSLILQIGIYSYIAIRLFKLSFKQFILKLLFFLAILFVVYIGCIIMVEILLVVTGNIELLQSMAISPSQ